MNTTKKKIEIAIENYFKHFSYPNLEALLKILDESNLIIVEKGWNNPPVNSADA